MERSTDKLFIYLACLALLAMRALGDAGAADVAAATAAAHGGMLGIGATDVVVALAAVSATALNEALPTRTRPLAPIALGVIAIFSPTGFLFLPLACYDAARELHRVDWLRACIAVPAVALAAALPLHGTGFTESFLVAACSALAVLLSMRTNRMLARQETLYRTRDDMMHRAQQLLHENRSLEARLAALDEQPARQPQRTQNEPPSRPATFACLTDREFEVARLIADGFDNREIAAAAYMSEGTVRNHISSILMKLRLKNRTQIAIAYWRG
ncbi:LuxR C-terminal-related transcriptional regulator [uncultured Enorma sp.]|uniref:helix-turn-helix transcriptional regulator n=1 Tax=uncultured Enorma sp. TaxID=1714346 RepID=UPI0026604C4B|nr:LuxR C-terminal-related transcriptional regulator [uncultured Enorma sp.]